MNMGGFLAIALSILVIFALIFPVVQGNTSVGVFVSLVTSFMAMAQSLTWQLPGMLKEMEQGRQLLGDMRRILELPEYEENRTVAQRFRLSRWNFPMFRSIIRTPKRWC